MLESAELDRVPRHSGMQKLEGDNPTVRGANGSEHNSGAARAEDRVEAVRSDLITRTGIAEPAIDARHRSVAYALIVGRGPSGPGWHRR
jgi:hypothetical protein